METFFQDGQLCQRWRCGASTYTACMELGARLMRWELSLPTGTREVIHWPQDVALSSIASMHGGNPILFPFPGRSYADGEKFAWLDTEGIKRPMPQHGLARQGRFKLAHCSANGVESVFLPDAVAHSAYPYDYTFRVRYTFRELALLCELELTNHGVCNIPWCAGHHFYFTLPWHKGLSRVDYTINLPSKKHFRHAADGKLVPFRDVTFPSDFANPEIRDLICTKLKSNRLSFGPKSGEEDIAILINDLPIPDAWTTVVTWTRDDESPFYCVEPWMGPPNCPEHKNGLHWVAPGETEKFAITVSLF
ncbi:MAG: hypothetical protein LBD01_00185 [Puniceicoccales bacterium]|nr:hypothetical protein [Puniceicoccales bacterium]